MKKIVRIKRVDLPGDKKIGNIITRIKGIKFAMSNAILNTLNINSDTLLGELPDEKLEKLKNAIDNPSSLGIPEWLFNRRKDLETGENKHLTGMDIPLVVREDIKRMKETKSLKGFRHGMGLKVRGQRTKSHPRRGRAVGVITKKKAAKMQKKEGKKQETKKSANKSGSKKK